MIKIINKNMCSKYNDKNNNQSNKQKKYMLL